MVKNGILVTLAALLAALVVWSGAKTLQQNAKWLLVFGLACAFLAPLVLEILKHLVTAGTRERDRQKLDNLYKVGDINELINEAATMEEKVRLLNEERRRLGEIIRIEAFRQSLIQRRDALETDANRILKDYQALDVEFKSIRLDIASEETIRELENLRDRLAARQKNLLIFFWRDRQYVVDAQKYAEYLPSGAGTFVRDLARLNNYFHEKRTARRLTSASQPETLRSDPTEASQLDSTAKIDRIASAPEDKREL